MLTQLLRRETCAACRSCCWFNSYDIWSTPVLNGETRLKAEALLPDAKFLQKGENAWVFRIEELDAEDNFPCPLLDPDKGCMLGTDKPFTCSLWPVQIMEIGGRQAITLSPLCAEIQKQPLAAILSFIKEELADRVFAYAAAHPLEVLPYDGVSVILLWKS